MGISCSINNFLKENKIGGAESTSLKELPVNKQVEIKSFTDSVKELVENEGFNLEILSLSKDGNKINLNNENLKIFDKYLESKSELAYATKASIEEALEEEGEMLGESNIIPIYDLNENQFPSFNNQVNDPNAKPVLSEAKFDNDDITENIKLYKSSREFLLENLKKTYEFYKKRKEYDKLNRIHNEMQLVKSEIDLINKGENFKSVLETVEFEAMAILDIISIMKDDTGNVTTEEKLSVMNTLLLQDRVKTLVTLFKGVHINSSNTFTNTDVNPISLFHTMFEQLREGSLSGKNVVADLVDFNNTLDLVNGLEKEFKNVQMDMVEILLKSDVSLKHQQYLGNYTAEDVEEMLNSIRDGKIGTSSINARYLGAGHNGLISQILSNSFEASIGTEKAFVKDNLDLQEKLFAKIALLKNPDTGFDIITSLFGVDNFGIINTGKLIKPLEHRFNESISSLYKKRIPLVSKNSTSSKRKSAYKGFIKELDKNFEVLDIRMLPQLQEKFGSHPVFGNSFFATKIDQENYLKDLEKKYGESYIQYAVDKAIKSVEDYETSMTSGTYESQEHMEASNPFTFLDNYISQNKENTLSSGEYADTKFNFLMPKDSVNVNHKFKELDKLPGRKDLVDYYIVTEELVKHQNEVGNSEGVTSDSHSLVQREDRCASQMFREASLFGRAWHYIKEYFDRYWSSNFNKAQERVEEDSVDFNLNKKLQIPNAKFASRQKVVDENYYHSFSTDELETKAREVGIDVVEYKKNFIFNHPEEVTIVESIYRKELIKSISEKEINRLSSMDLHRSVQEGVELAVRAKARSQALAVLEVLKEFTRNQITNDNDNSGKKELLEFLESWSDLNLRGYRFPGDYNNLEGKNATNALASTTNAKSKSKWGFKYESLLNKRTLKILKDFEKRYEDGKVKDITAWEEVNGVKKEVVYSNVNGSYKRTYIDNNGKPVFTNVTEADHRKAFEDFCELLRQEQSIKMTVGSFCLGFSKNLSQKYLMWGVRSGIKNRFQGKVAAEIAGASERFGFTSENVYNAEVFLKGVNLKKTGPLKNWFSKTEKGKNIETMNMLLNKLDILQHRSADLENLNPGFGRLLDNLRNTSMDFAINNPEYKNQAIIALSILQNTFVFSNKLDSNGNPELVPVFNGETGEFIYEPGTLNLREELDNPENVTYWKKFKQNENGSASLATIIAIKAVIKKTNGNYSDTDRAVFEGTAAMKTFSMFKKHIPEKIASQYSKQDFDIRTGQKAFEGTMRLLAKYPVLGATVASGRFLPNLINRFPMIGSTIGQAALTTFGASIAVGSTAVTIATCFYFAIKQNKQEAYKIKKDLRVTGFYYQTMLNRAMVTLGQKTRIRAMKGYFAKQGENLKDKALQDLGLNDNDLASLREIAQEVVSKRVVMIQYLIAAKLGSLILSAIYNGILGDDDDEEKKKKDPKYIKWVKEALDAESYVTAMLNDQKSMEDEITYATSPTGLVNNIVNSVAISGGKNIIDIINKDYSNKGGIFTYDNLVPIVNTVTPFIPNQVGKMARTDKGILHDDKSNMERPFTSFEKEFIIAESLSNEKKAAYILKNLRTNYKEVKEKYYKKALSEEQYDKYSDEEKEDFIEKTVKSDMRTLEKDTGEKHSETLKRLDINNKIKDVQKYLDDGVPITENNNTEEDEED